MDMVPRTFEVEDDPNVALVSFRTALEERLRKLAEREGVDPRASLLNVLHELESKRVLNREAVDGIFDLVAVANEAAHGTPVSRETLFPLREKGADLLDRLDALAVR